MKITLAQLKKFISEAVEESKDEVEPVPMMADEKLDFSRQTTDKGLYARQGAANFGPYTEEKALRYVISQMIRETNVGAAVVGLQKPLCQHLYKVKPSQNIWERVMAVTEATCGKCGQKITEKHLGFKKLKNKLAHKKGVKDPAALAASIGNKKFGKAGMAKKAAAGRK